MRDQIDIPSYDHRLDHTIWKWIAKQLVERISCSSSPLSSSIFLSRAHIWRAIQLELGGLIWELTPQAERMTISGSFHLAQTWRTNLSAHLVRSNTLASSWPTELPPPLLIKGADLELTLYPEFGLSPGSRMSTDWDLIIPKPYYQQLVQQWSDQFGPAIFPRSVRFSDEVPHEVGFYVNNMLIEVHLDPAPRFFSLLDGICLWEAGHEHTTPENFDVLLPHETHRLFIWLINYAKAGGAVRALSWIDLTLILSKLIQTTCGQSIQPDLVNFFIDLCNQSAQQGLERVLLVALKRWSLSPLIQVSPQWTKILTSEALTKMRSDDQLQAKLALTTTMTPLQIALNQVKFCAPQLRAEYLIRGLNRLVKFS